MHISGLKLPVLTYFFEFSLLPFRLREIVALPAGCFDMWTSC